MAGENVRGETIRETITGVMLQETRTIMGMPVDVAILDASASQQDLEEIFAWFMSVDCRFSPYKGDSELSRVNRGEIAPQAQSAELQEVFALAEKTRVQSHGYFDIRRADGSLDPCGIVKGWAIHKAACLLRQKGYENFCVDAGGDIQSAGRNAQGQEWRIGIRNPFAAGEIVKVLYPKGAGIATSGSYLQGAHIYNPHAPEQQLGDVVSLTVVGPDILEADRFATAAFAMGRAGIGFLEQLSGFEAYEIDAFGVARMTSGLERHLAC